MARNGSKTKQRNANRIRLGILLALFATAALAPGYGRHSHRGGTPGGLRVAMAVMPAGGGSFAGHAGGNLSGHSGSDAGGHKKHAHPAPAGPRGDTDGFVSNGENGLILLANYLPEGGLPGAGDGPTGGETAGDGFQTAENNFGGSAGGGVGGGSGGGGGGGGGSGGGGPGGGNGFTGSGPDGVDGNGNGGGGTDSKPPGGKTPGETIIDQFPTPGDGDPCELTNSCDAPRDFGPKVGDNLPGGGPDVGPVPEPATWLMLIAGFMGVGSALRAQRRRAVLA